MRAGPLNRRIAVQRRTAVQDETGQPLEEWSEVCRPWANILHKSGSETIKADAPTSVVSASIRIRYRNDITAGMRVLHGAVVYAIQAVLPDEVRREHIDLVCQVVEGAAP